MDRQSSCQNNDTVFLKLQIEHSDCQKIPDVPSVAEILLLEDACKIVGCNNLAYRIKLSKENPSSNNHSSLMSLVTQSANTSYSLAIFVIFFTWDTFWVSWHSMEISQLAIHVAHFGFPPGKLHILSSILIFRIYMPSSLRISSLKTNPDIVTFQSFPLNHLYGFFTLHWRFPSASIKYIRKHQVEVLPLIHRQNLCFYT